MKKLDEKKLDKEMVKWAAKLGKIAQTQSEVIKNRLLTDESFKQQFDDLLVFLQDDTSTMISENELIDMLAQQMLCKPIFESLFEEDSFINSNPISVRINSLLKIVRGGLTPEDAGVLNQAETEINSILNTNSPSPAEKRALITKVYDDFFRTAAPKTTKQLGIVYSPDEIVNFMLNSVDDLCRQEFGINLGDKGVKILEPFAGTGIFLSNLIASDIIPKENLAYKLKNDIYGVELLLLAYYMANANIDLAIQQRELGDNTKYSNLKLADTFKLYDEGKPPVVENNK